MLTYFGYALLNKRQEKMTKDEDIKEHIARNPSMVKKFIKIYNKMCGRCKQKCLSRPKRPMEEYCAKCQEMARKIMGG